VLPRVRWCGRWANQLSDTSPGVARGAVASSSEARLVISRAIALEWNGARLRMKSINCLLARLERRSLTMPRACSASLQAPSRSGCEALARWKDRRQRQRFHSGCHTRDVYLVSPRNSHLPQGVPARWYEIHHVIHWADEGPISVASRVALCDRHHRLVHHSNWWIEMTGGILESHPLPWIDGPPRHSRFDPNPGVTESAVSARTMHPRPGRPRRAPQRGWRSGPVR
jgi:hypothetical protein